MTTKIPTNSDSERLDWLLAHPGSEFNEEGPGMMTLCAWLSPSDGDHPIRAGHYLARGADARACIDAAKALQVIPCE